MGFPVRFTEEAEKDLSDAATWFADEAGFELARLDELRSRRLQVNQAIGSLLTLDDPEREFLQSVLKDLHVQLKSLDESI